MVAVLFVSIRGEAMRPCNRVLVAAAAHVVVACFTVSASAGPATVPTAPDGGWTVNEKVSPLTDQLTVSATHNSNDLVLNTLGRPDTATLVVRCSEGVMATYIAWPDVLENTGSPLGGTSATPVAYRVDDSQIVSEDWSLASGGTSAGAFTTAGATRLLSVMAGKRRLVVRLTGRIEQDAVFDISGIDQVITRMSDACKTPVAAATWRGLPLQGAPVKTALINSKAATLAAVASLLETRGFHIKTRDAAAGTVTTDLSPLKLTTKDVDCGKSWGMSYLIDGRVKTSVAYFVTVSDDGLEVRTAIEGVQNLGFGMDRLLVCKSVGRLEANLIASLPVAKP